MHLFRAPVPDRLKVGMENLEEEILIAARKLYPTLTETEAKQAGRNLCRYFEIVCEIEWKEAAAHKTEFDITGAGPSIKERSNCLKI